MTGPAIGLDLVEVGRLERALERRPRLAERLFTARELGFAKARPATARHLAARFAAKEACIKALGGPPLAPRDIEVTGGGREAPALVLHGQAGELAAERGLTLNLSLSHTGDTAAAAVLVKASSSSLAQSQ